MTAPDRTLAAALERMAAVAQSVMDAGPPVLADGTCAHCLLQVDEPADDAPAVPVVEHDPSECGWWIARNQLCQADVTEVRRLAHVLRYDAASKAADGRRER